jgi:hypothetical protein
MIVTRRNFLRSGVMSVLLAGLALDSIPSSFAQKLRKTKPSQDFQVPFQAKQEPVFYFKQETFEPYLNGVFTLRAGAKSIEAVLVEVRDCTPSPNASRLPSARKGS